MDKKAFDLDSLFMVYDIWGKPIGGGREGVQAGRGTNTLPHNDHLKITRIIVDMHFGLPGPLWTVKKYARCGNINARCF